MILFICVGVSVAHCTRCASTSMRSSSTEPLDSLLKNRLAPSLTSKPDVTLKPSIKVSFIWEWPRTPLSLKSEGLLCEPFIRTLWRVTTTLPSYRFATEIGDRLGTFISERYQTYKGILASTIKRGIVVNRLKSCPATYKSETSRGFYRSVCVR